MSDALWRLCLMAGVTIAVGCGVETVIHDIGEKEANEIVVLLSNNDILAQKGMRDTGRKIVYSISVAPSQRLAALRLLNDHDYPRREIAGYAKVFAEGGLIPTSAEERAKKLQAIEGEIEKQLTLIHGILDAQVNLVIPEVNPLSTSQDVQTPATASVTVKYLPGDGGRKPVHDQQIQAIVAAGVEKLTSDHVVVVMTQAKAPDSAVAADCPEVAVTARGRGFFGRFSSKTQQLILVGVTILILLLSLLLIYGQVRLRNVRGRLIRLQNEIAKARRRAPDSMPAVTE